MGFLHTFFVDFDFLYFYRNMLIRLHNCCWVINEIDKNEIGGKIVSDLVAYIFKIKQ